MGKQFLPGYLTALRRIGALGSAKALFARSTWPIRMRRRSPSAWAPSAASISTSASWVARSSSHNGGAARRNLGRRRAASPCARPRVASFRGPSNNRYQGGWRRCCGNSSRSRSSSASITIISRPLQHQSDDAGADGETIDGVHGTFRRKGRTAQPPMTDVPLPRPSLTAHDRAQLLQ